jgi:hypothetical protein
MQVLLDGELYGKVKSFEQGSVWSISKEGNKLVRLNCHHAVCSHVVCSTNSFRAKLALAPACFQSLRNICFLFNVFNATHVPAAICMCNRMGRLHIRH